MYTLISMPFLDNYEKCYRNILVVNTKPTGPLSTIVKLINPPKLSPFQVDSKCCPQQKCVYAITDLENKHEFMCVNDIPKLFTFLVENGYTIDTSITKMMQNSTVKMDNSLLCFIH